ncbi:MAG: UUP1 family membrane protein [Rhodospirillaceae bacterium]
MKNRLVYGLAILCFVLGTGLFAYKIAVLDFPVAPDNIPDNWEVEARVTFQSTGGPVSVRLFTPRNTRNHTILDQSFVGRGYMVNTDNRSEGRSATLTSRRGPGGQQTVYFRFLVNQADRLLPPSPAGEWTPVTPTWLDTQLDAAKAIMAAARKNTKGDRGAAVEVVKILNEKPSGQQAAVLLGVAPGAERTAYVAVGILTVGGITARTVHGIDLAHDLNKGQGKGAARFLHWIEVVHNGHWRRLSLDPSKPKIPATWFPWWYGPSKFVHVTGGSVPKVRVVSRPASDRALVEALGRSENPNLLISAMKLLPIEAQQVYRVILVVPLGVLVLVIFRNIIGIKSFGTFMPVLIALAFRETQLLWGITLFIVIVSIGLAIRLWMERLKLLVVPRLGAVLIVVVGAMAGLSVLSSQFGLTGGLSIALFPMVILTMTVERMSVIWDERGPRAAVQQGVGSLAMATICYLIISNPLSEHLFFTFPELLLVTLAFVLLLGRYSGYRLTELIRFGPLSRAVNSETLK